ncbi:centrosomal protein of 70 kDa isoform X2 [Echeneis naucrates]|uniref:centrosomal protein of 70 kDa isoform X2 n=1 Tax=Echeneis naucrates TaxID=173247 RepID=UPI0011142E04|nr:centrosomal protein of 70 kDa isoform X2 [Echeneis naucrates]
MAHTAPSCMLPSVLQQEQVDWDHVNKLLQHHGFKPVCFADPVENKNLSDLVLLDKRSAGEIRAALRTMLMDSERRQSLIQELSKSNNHLKEEIQEHMSRAAQLSQQTTELQGLLDAVKTRVQDLEDRYLAKEAQHHRNTQQLQQQKEETQKQCAVLKLKLSREREKTAQLQSKLYFTIKEEERLSVCQSRTFQQICKRISRHNSAADQQVLDVIMFYENEMSRLLDELRSLDHSSVKDESRQKQMKSPNIITPSFKIIIKAYREQQRERRAQIEELKMEVEQLKQELETKLLQEDNTNDSKKNGDQDRGVSLSDHYRHLLTEISAVMTNHRAPIRLDQQKPSAFDSNPAEFGSLLPTLETWAQQLHLLKELQQGLTKLMARLMAGQFSDGSHDATEAVKVEEMMLMVDTMLESTSVDDKMVRSPTRYTLGSMVSHFQKLFDVTSLSGVYPRMNEVYTRLGEMTNAMKNLQDVLDLDSRASPEQVVNQVTRMVSLSGQTAGLCDLVGDADIDSIIVKMKQHEEFFPPFHALIMDISQTLGVSHLDDILPALRSLTQKHCD